MIWPRRCGTRSADEPACLVRLPLGWAGADLEAAHPLDFLGMDGGAGIGSGPGMAVGAALALEGSGRLPVAVLGDGDFLMGGTAVWTAAHYRLPLLIVVANNAFYYNDVVHQERVRGSATGRPGTPGSARPSPTPSPISAPWPDPRLPGRLTRSATGPPSPPRSPKRSPPPAPASASWSTSGSARTTTPPWVASCRQKNPGQVICRTGEVISAGGTHTHLALVDGERVGALSGATLDVVNPATNKVIGQIPRCDERDVEAAVAAAKRPRPAGGRPSPSCARPRCSLSPTR